MSEFHNLMALINNHSDEIGSGDYLKMSDLLLSIRSMKLDLRSVRIENLENEIYRREKRIYITITNPNENYRTVKMFAKPTTQIKTIKRYYAKYFGIDDLNHITLFFKDEMVNDREGIQYPLYILDDWKIMDGDTLNAIVHTT